MIASKRNLRLEVRYTYDFIRRFLPPDGRRLLEIGCGTGELAARLTEDGFQVTAIDSDQELVGAAGQLGVNAHVAEWPDFDDGHFDAVLFTRSLHHIQPLRDAVQHAVACLSESGRIIVEDFAYEDADEKTLRWLSSAVLSSKTQPACWLSETNCSMPFCEKAPHSHYGGSIMITT